MTRRTLFALAVAPLIGRFIPKRKSSVTMTILCPSLWADFKEGDTLEVFDSSGTRGWFRVKSVNGEKAVLTQ